VPFVKLCGKNMVKPDWSTMTNNMMQERCDFISDKFGRYRHS